MVVLKTVSSFFRELFVAKGMSKGVSQVLAIVTAAAVLLVLAATLIVVMQGGFDNITDWIDPRLEDPEDYTDIDD